MKNPLLTIATLTLALGSPLLAVDRFWTGTTDQAWNDPSNWGGTPPGIDDAAIVDIAVGNFPIITVTTTEVSDTKVGTGVNTGRLDHQSGTHNSGADNWMFIGVDGGTGTYNLADTTTGGGGISGFAQGTGSVNTGNQLIVGWGGGNGTMNVNTSGTIATNETGSIGNGAIGVANFEAGTWTMNNEFFVGNNGAGGGDGTLNMAGGSITCDQWMVVGRDGGTGVINLSGGIIKFSNNNDHHAAIGTNGGTGTVNQTGGTFEAVGDNGLGNIMLGENGASSGTYVQDGGTANTNGLWIGNNGTTTGSYTLNNGTTNAGEVILGRFDTADGTLNLNGGFLNATSITKGTGTGAVNFNSTLVTILGNSANFLTGLTVDVQAGGINIDTNGFDAIGAGASVGGTGGVTKGGLGTLGLLGASNSYTGNNIILGGCLELAAGSGTGTGGIVVSDAACFGIFTPVVDDQLTSSSVAFLGTATTFNVDVGNVTGTNPTVAPLVATILDVNGTVTVNVAGSELAVGNLPLLDYDNTARTGAGSFTLGTLPNGVAASLVDDPDFFGTDLGLVYLDITDVALPRWNGDQGDGKWDTVDNWIDQVTTNPITYTDPNPVLFNDDATGDTNVILDVAVAPSEVLFQNDVNIYTLTGIGAIGGSTGLVKKGSESLTITSIANTYTGPTRIDEGILSTDSITNASVAGTLGAADATPANLEIAGGTLQYTGAGHTTDRGIALNSGGIITDGSLTVTGDTTSSGAGVNKTGADDLNLQGSGALGAFRVNEGPLSLNGPGQILTGPSLTVGDAGSGSFHLDNGVGSLTLTGTMDLRNSSATNSEIISGTISVGSEFWVGNEGGNTGKLDMSGGEINTQQWFVVGRNGGIGEFNLSGGTVNANLNNTFTVLGSGGGTAVVNHSGGTFNHTNSLNLGENGVFDATYNLSGTGTVNATALFVGGIGDGTALFKQTGGTLTTTGVAGPAVGGENTGESRLANGANTTGTYDMQGGVATFGDSFQIGARGVGILNQSGGTMNANVWPGLGRFGGSDGTANISGGAFNQLGSSQRFTIGEDGIGVLNLSATGLVTTEGGIRLGVGATGDGTINLNGGTIETPLIEGGAGPGRLHLNGGIIRATDSTDPFIAGVTVDVQAGGFFIDTDGFFPAITVDLPGVGGFDKVGTGTLFIDSVNGYDGDTNVGGGTLSMLNPIFANSSTVNVASGAGAVLDLNFVGNDIVNEFEIDGAPQGPGIYDATSNPGEISGTGKLEVVPFVADPYDPWIDSFFPGETNPLIIGKTADPDGDGWTNKQEFALGGDPSGGTLVAGGGVVGIYDLAENSDADGDTDPELLITILVRAGTPAFSAGPAPSATHDGCTYTIVGSTILSSFTGAVTPTTTPVTTGLPAAPAGYEYRTFSLDSSNGLTGAGFLGVQISP